MEIKPIGYIETDFKEKFGIPRQSGRVPESAGRIVFYPEFRNPDAIRGIERFSHIWLIFDFTNAHRDKVSMTVRPPRLGGNTRVGVFASRSPFRPNSIGISSVKLDAIEHTDSLGDVIMVSGIDLLDKTEIYEMKPYVPYADCHTDAIGGYAEDMKDYRLDVIFPFSLLSLIDEKKRTALCKCLADDPRPSYQDDAERLYSMKFSHFDIHFRVAEGKLTVVSVEDTDK